MRVIFLSHLKKEDAKMYPILREAAKSDGALKRRLDSFASDMDKISLSVTEFFEKYTSAEVSSSIEFAMDFGSLSAKLINRIWREENILYKEFEKAYRRQE